MNPPFYSRSELAMLAALIMSSHPGMNVKDATQTAIDLCHECERRVKEELAKDPRPHE